MGDSMGLSVIIPVYNGEKYIEDCLNSIIKQTYKDLQIIVVNDGSKDNTESIILNMSKRDSRIQIISKKNGGVSSARNIGVKYAKEDCITFVDDDDTLDLDMYEMLMKYIDDGYDIAHCGYKRISKEKIKLVNGTGSIIVQNKEDALKCLISGKLFVGSLCNKVYKRNLFKNIKFDESLKINEDILVNYKVFKNSNKSIFIDEAKYNYFERESSVCKDTDWIKKGEDSIIVAKYMYEDCSNNLKNEAFNRYLNCLIDLYRAYYYSHNKGKSKDIKYKIDKVAKEGVITSNKNKIQIKIIKYTSFLYGPLYKIYDKIRVPNWDV